MAAKLGKIVLDAVLPEGSTGVDLTAIATGETLDKLVKGALAVLVEHPDLMGIDDPGIEELEEWNVPLTSLICTGVGQAGAVSKTPLV